LLWGRLAYHMDIESEYFISRFQHHFGTGAGSTMWHALQDASQVIPAINAVVQRGPKRTLFSPELEPPLTLRQLQEAQSLDLFCFQHVREEAEEIITGIPDGRISPTTLLDDAANRAEKAVQLIKEIEPSISGKTRSQRELIQEQEAYAVREWESWKLDFEALASLANCWRDQLKASVAWNLFLNTGDAPSLVLASENLKNAQSAWNRVQQKTAQHYRSLLLTVGESTGLYHWKDAENHWQDDLQMITETYNQWLNRSEWISGIGHLPQHQTEADQPMLLSYSIPPPIDVGKMFVHYQNSYGMTGQVQMDDSNLEGVYYAQIPSSVVKDGVIQYYFIGEINGETVELLSPGEGKPYIVAVSSDHEPPKVAALDHELNSNQVNVHAQFSDSAGIFEAILYWKPLPSGEAWNEQPMQRSSSGFHASIPKLAEGVQYAVEVSDNFANARKLPDPREGMPYRVILPGQ